jgi:hypothetical protein
MCRTSERGMPESFLNPKSAYGFIYFAFIAILLCKALLAKSRNNSCLGKGSHAHSEATQCLDTS